MNKKFGRKSQVCAGAVLLLPLFAHAASTVTLPGILPTTTTGTSSSAKLSGTVSSLAATTSSVTSLPQLSPAPTPSAATASSGSGGIPLPGLEGLGGGSGSLPIGKLPGIRPIRLPGPNPN